MAGRSGPCTPRSEGLSSLEAEVQKMRVEMASMKRDAKHYSRQEHMELGKRYRELADLLELIQQLITLLSSHDTYLTGCSAIAKWGLPLWKEKSRCPTSHKLQTRCFLAGKIIELVELSSVLQFDSNNFFTQKSQRFLLTLTFEVHAVGFRLMLLICSWKVEALTLSSELE